MGYMLTKEKITDAARALRDTSTGFLLDKFVCSAYNAQFSQELPLSAKQHLRDLFIENFRREAKLRNPSEAGNAETIFTGRIIAPIMSGGYWYASKIFGQMELTGLSPDVVFPGYWSSTRKIHGGFVNPDLMLAEDRLYLTDADMETLRRHTTPRILLVDNVIETGKTILGVAESLNKMGIKDILCYVIEDRRKGLSETNFCSVLGIEGGLIRHIKNLYGN